MWRFVIVWSDRDEAFDFRVLDMTTEDSRSLMSSSIVYSGLDRSRFEEAAQDMSLSYNSISCVQRWEGAVH